MAETPYSRLPRNGGATHEDDESSGGIAGLMRNLLGSNKGRREGDLREAIEGLIEDEENGNAEASIAEHEKVLLSNILRLQDLTAEDVMVPRADIVAVEVETPLADILDLLSKRAHSRLPVYRESLDNVVGMLHIKDLIPQLALMANGETNVTLTDMARELPVVAPSIPVLNLLLQMREARRHMALVVDEFGGIDGLITIEDLVEEIVGEIEDEHDVSTAPQMVAAPNGSHLIDARVPLEEFEAVYGPVLPEDDREDIDTVGGYVFTMAGRVPTRGEMVRDPEHRLEFLVTEADPRRVRKLRVSRMAIDSGEADSGKVGQDKPAP